MALDKATEWAVAVDATYDPYHDQPQAVERRAVDEARFKLAQAMDLEDTCRRVGDLQMQIGAIVLCLARVDTLSASLGALRIALVSAQTEVAEKKPEW